MIVPVLVTVVRTGPSLPVFSGVGGRVGTGCRDGIWQGKNNRIRPVFFLTGPCVKNVRHDHDRD